MPDRIAFPTDWLTASIKDIVDPSRAITYGIVQPGSRFDPDRGIPMIRGQDYSSGTVWKDDLYYVDPRLAASFARASVQGGDLLMSIVGYVGTVAEVPDELAGANLTQTTARIAVREDIKGRYFLHFLRSHYFKDEVKRFTKGSAQPGLNLADVEVMRVAYPRDASDRATIANVLDALDTTIRQTEAIIEKLKQVKQGLLHDLLTRGIDANGELRPPQSQAPDLYKESPLGWIPGEWEVCGVLDIAPAERQCILTGPFGAQLGQADFVAEGVPVLRIGNVQAGFIDWSDVQFVSHAKAGRLERFSVLAGDLLFARQGATTGRNALADERANGALINYHIIRVAVDRECCEPVYLHALFNSDQSKGQVDQEKGRGTREGINSKQIAALRFALPRIEEQRMLVARMTSLSKAMDQESIFAAKLRLQKAGLMDDLLTGRVRVTPLLA